jgi:hypothetical protein
MEQFKLTLGEYMSSKSSQGPHEKSGFSKKMLVIAVIIGIAFITIIIAHPRIFSPSNIGQNTGPAAPAPTDTNK